MMASMPSVESSQNNQKHKNETPKFREKRRIRVASTNRRSVAQVIQITGKRGYDGSTAILTCIERMRVARLLSICSHRVPVEAAFDIRVLYLPRVDPSQFLRLMWEDLFRHNAESRQHTLKRKEGGMFLSNY